MSFEKFPQIKDETIISSLFRTPNYIFLQPSLGRLKMTVELAAVESISGTKPASLMSSQKVVPDDTRGAEVKSLHGDLKKRLSIRIFRKSEEA